MVTSTFQPAAPAANPASALAAALATLRRVGRSAFTALEAVGRQRSAAYLNQLADDYATSRPDFSRRMREAARGQHVD